MGRPSKLTDAQWAELGQRLASGEKAADLAKESGVSKAAFSRRFSGKQEAPSQPAPPPKRPRGRPSTFKQDIADEICQRLSDGEPLAEICQDDKMPAVRTVSHWKESNAAFMADFARAREEGFDQIAADCLKIADDTSDDTLYGERGPHANTEWISRSKLRIETRLKLLAKWDPKRYGDKVQTELTGPNGGPVEISEIRRVVIDSAAAK